MTIKYIVEVAIGFLGALVSVFIGDITPQLITFLWLMLFDLVSGLIVATVFKKSRKTESGGLSSKEMLKGIFRKIGMLVLIAVAYRIDITLDINAVKNGTIIALILEELLSIIENLGLMGIPIPSVITNSIDILSKKVNEVLKNV